MQKNVTMVLAVGFFFGLGLASCATSESVRDIAGENRPHSMRASQQAKPEGRDCYTGEERDESGQCVRVQHIERPARRGGR